MPNRTHPRPENLCTAPECFAAALELAPVPLCPTHIRETYEFAAALVNSRWSTALAEQHLEAVTRAETVVAAAADIEHELRSGGYVYFVRFSDRIKIGWSSAPRERIANLPHDEVLAVVPGSMQDERAYHARFHHLRCYGEWFRTAPDLIKFINDLQDRAA